MNKHTPGPWVVELSGRMVATAADGAHGYELFDVRHDVPGFQENALLAAAAPELLEALELADAVMSGANMDMRVVERKVKAAIAKARGEA